MLTMRGLPRETFARLSVRFHLEYIFCGIYSYFWLLIRHLLPSFQIKWYCYAIVKLLFFINLLAKTLAIHAREWVALT